MVQALVHMWVRAAAQVSSRELDNVRHAKTAVNKLLTRVKTIKKVLSPAEQSRLVF